MIVATAGHIDHGKTALIKALTGVDADRLPDEKRRGITLDLGFAYRRGVDGRMIGFVDVPGHEKLVHTMLAGATGVHFVILVIAADDGVMPQTREHLAILDLLAVRRGAVAITKIDRVDASRVQDVVREARALIAGTALADAAILPLSSHRGDGVESLRVLLESSAAALSPPERQGQFRFAVDRAFTVAGAGLVATGIVHAGQVVTGDRLILASSGREVRVRGLHANSERTDAGAAGQRCALNIVGPRVGKEDLPRGAWIIAPPLTRSTTCLDLSLTLLASEARALRHWTPVHVHLGSDDLPGRVSLLEGEPIGPGATALARLVLERPTSACSGDRLVLRDQSARRTLGGGRVIDPEPPKRKARTVPRLSFLRAFDNPDDGAALDEILASAPVDLDHFKRCRNLAPHRVEGLLATRNLVTVALPNARMLVSAPRWDALRADVLVALENHRQANPDAFGATAGEILRHSPAGGREMLAAALNALAGAKAIGRVGHLFHLPGHEAALTTTEEDRWRRLAASLEGSGCDVPRVASIATRLDVEEAEVAPLLRKLSMMGRLTRVSKAYYLLPAVVLDLARAAQACVAANHENLLTVGRFREMTGIGRHATMPVLEFFDRVGLTQRCVDGRRLRAQAEAIFAAGERDAGS